MAAHSFSDLMQHVNHEVAVTTFGNPPVNVAVVCDTCCEVILDFDRDAEDEDGAADES